MCRAVWVVVLARDAERAKALRRAAGADVQVVAMATSEQEATSILDGTLADAIVVDAAAPGAAAAAAAARAREPRIAVVWVGADPPGEEHVAVADADGIAEELPGAITRALLARGSA